MTCIQIISGPPPFIMQRKVHLICKKASNLSIERLMCLVHLQRGAWSHQSFKYGRHLLPGMFWHISEYQSVLLWTLISPVLMWNCNAIKKIISKDKRYNVEYTELIYVSLMCVCVRVCLCEFVHGCMRGGKDLDVIFSTAKS